MLLLRVRASSLAQLCSGSVSELESAPSPALGSSLVVSSLWSLRGSPLLAAGLSQLRRHCEAVPGGGGRLGVLHHAGGARVHRVEPGVRPERRASGLLQRRQDGAHLAAV